MNNDNTPGAQTSEESRSPYLPPMVTVTRLKDSVYGADGSVTDFANTNQPLN